MSAKEMFKKLNFELYNDTAHEINYFNKNFISETNIISFDKNTKNIDCLVESDSPFTPNAPYQISIEILHAINQQVKELGWLDE